MSARLHVEFCLSAAIVSLFLNIQLTDGEQGYGGCRAVVEYFDGVVDACQPCADVCLPCDLSNSATFCAANCLEYYRKHCQDPTYSTSRTTKTRSTVQPSDPILGGSLWENPLFWLSIGCLIVAVLATVAMVALILICRKSNRDDRDQRLLSSNLSSPNYSRSTSESSNGTVDDKKYPLLGHEAAKTGLPPDIQPRPRIDV